MVTAAIRLAWARSKPGAALHWVSHWAMQSRWMDWLFVTGVVALSLVAWQVKPLMQAPQALGECLQSEVLSVSSMPPACLEDVIKKHGDDRSVVLGILTLTTPAVSAKTKNSAWWCSTTRLAFKKYDGRTRWSDWKQGLWGGDERLNQDHLEQGRKLCGVIK